MALNETSESMFVFAFHPGGGVSHDISEDAEEDLSGKGCFLKDERGFRDPQKVCFVKKKKAIKINCEVSFCQ